MAGLKPKAGTLPTFTPKIEHGFDLSIKPGKQKTFISSASELLAQSSSDRALSQRRGTNLLAV